jgi:hypothetical protein
LLAARTLRAYATAHALQADFTLGSRRPLRALRAARAFVAGSALRADRAFGPCEAHFALRAGGPCGPCLPFKMTCVAWVSCGSLRSRQADGALRAVSSRCARGPSRALIALRTGLAGGAGLALRTDVSPRSPRSLRTLRAQRADRPFGTRRAVNTLYALRAARALQAGCAGRALRAGCAVSPRRSLLALRPRLTGGSVRSPGSPRALRAS